MDAAKLKGIIEGGEGTEVELKQSFQSVQDVARIISAFANTQGGLLILGVGDDGKILGLKDDLDQLQQKISHASRIVHPAPIISIETHTLDGKRLIVVATHKADASVFHSAEGVIFVRIGSTIQKLEGQSIIEFLRNRQILLFEESIEQSAKLDDIDSTKVKLYLEKRGQASHLEKHSLKDFLLSRKLASLQPDLRIKNAALLFFAKNPDTFLPYTQIRLVRFGGNERMNVIAYENTEGGIPQAIEHAANFVMRFIPKRFVIEGLQRVEIPALPASAIREAVINAVAHRDYFNKNEIQVGVFDDRVEITNPGGLPEGMTEQLLGTLSVQRNPMIYQLLKDYGYMEGIGSGITKMRSLMKEAGLTGPEFSLSKDFFMIIFRIKPEGTAIQTAKLSKRQAKALEYLRKNGSIKSKDYASMNKVSVPTAIRDLGAMGKTGFVKKVGKMKGTYYVLNEGKSK